jgi:hypothetical protein
VLYPLPLAENMITYGCAEESRVTVNGDIRFTLFLSMVTQTVGKFSGGCPYALGIFSTNLNRVYLKPLYRAPEAGQLPYSSILCGGGSVMFVPISPAMRSGLAHFHPKFKVAGARF